MGEMGGQWGELGGMGGNEEKWGELGGSGGGNRGGDGGKGGGDMGKHQQTWMESESRFV